MNAAGGITSDSDAVLLGGYFGGWVESSTAWGLPLDADSLRAAGLFTRLRRDRRAAVGAMRCRRDRADPRVPRARECPSVRAVHLRLARHLRGRGTRRRAWRRRRVTSSTSSDGQACSRDAVRAAIPTARQVCSRQRCGSLPASSRSTTYERRCSVASAGGRGVMSDRVDARHRSHQVRRSRCVRRPRARAHRARRLGVPDHPCWGDPASRCCRMHGARSPAVRRSRCACRLIASRR